MRIINIYKLLQISLLCLLMGMTIGCAEKDSFEQPYLNVSEKELAFSNQIDEKKIAVNTNCKEWIATTPKPWVHLTQNGNELSVQVDANPTGMDRSSYILVDGGLAVQKIMVSQNASDILLDVTKGEVILPQAGGTTTVALKLEGATYDVTQGEKTEWLQVIKKKHGLKFVSQPNYDVTERTSKLTLNIAGKNYDMVVKLVCHSLS